MTDHGLPIPDYDSLATGSIESRARALSEEGVRELLDYERQHANRPQIIAMLEHRLEGLASGEVTPSGGDPQAPAPEVPQGVAGDTGVSPATEGPVQNPPSQGVPTNPAQPRT